jgi:uncharacterized protein YbgA (DUF1722 family)
MAFDEDPHGDIARLLADSHDKPVEEVIDLYERAFRSTLSKDSSISLNIKVLEHALGYFSERLTGEEKNSFAAEITLYEEGKKTLNGMIRVMKGWIDRYRVRELMSQTYFCRYPEEMGDWPV